MANKKCRDCIHFISTSKPGHKSEGECRKEHVKCLHGFDAACKTDFKPIAETNRDWLGRATLKELAAWLTLETPQAWCRNIDECITETCNGHPVSDEQCIACCMAWLEEPHA